VLLAAILHSSTVLGQSPADREQANALAQAGDERLQAKDYSTAATKFAAAEAILSRPTTKLALARSYIGLRRFPEARRLLKEIVDGPAPTESKNNMKAYEDASGELAALMPRFALVELSLSGLPADTKPTIQINTESVSPSALAAPQLVSPGQITVRVSADGYRPFETSFSLGEGQTKKLPVALEKAAPGTAGSAGSDARPTPESGGSPLRTAGLVVLVAGGVGGSILGGLAFSKVSSAKKDCNGNICSTSSKDAFDSAKTFGNLSTVGFVLAGAGLAMFFLGGSSSETKAASGARATQIGLGPGGISLAGQF
jgi:hypothetical protein